MNTTPRMLKTTTTDRLERALLSTSSILLELLFAIFFPYIHKYLRSFSVSLLSCSLRTAVEKAEEMISSACKRPWCLKIYLLLCVVFFVLNEESFGPKHVGTARNGLPPFISNLRNGLNLFYIFTIEPLRTSTNILVLA